MTTNKGIFYDQQILAMKLAAIFEADVRKKLSQAIKIKSYLPTIDSIYKKDIVREQEVLYKNSKTNIKTTESSTSSLTINNSNSKKKNNFDDSAVVDSNNNYFNNNNNSDTTSASDKDKDNGVNELRKTKSVITSTTTTNNTTATTSNKAKSNKSSSPTTQNKTPNSSLVSPNSNEKDDLDLMKTISTPSFANKLTINLKNNESNESEKKTKSLYRKRECSRFPFVGEKIEQNPDEVGEIPEFIFDIINKKISRHSFFKNLSEAFQSMVNDFVCFEKELTDNDPWAQFIKANMKIIE